MKQFSCLLFFRNKQFSHFISAMYIALTIIFCDAYQIKKSDKQLTLPAHLRKTENFKPVLLSVRIYFGKAGYNQSYYLMNNQLHFSSTNKINYS